MTIRLTVSMMLSAPGGASVEGREIVSPIGRACGPATGGANCCRSRPGCAPGGIACASALTGKISSNRPTNSRLTPGAMPASSPTQTPFHRDESETCMGGRRLEYHPSPCVTFRIAEDSAQRLFHFCTRFQWLGPLVCQPRGQDRHAFTGKLARFVTRRACGGLDWKGEQ